MIYECTIIKVKIEHLYYSQISAYFPEFLDYSVKASHISPINHP